MKTTAIIVAAGKSIRMGGDRPKQYMDLGGKPILAWTIEAFEKAICVDEIVIVSDDVDFVRSGIVEKFGFSKVRKITAGGPKRHYSVLYGLQSLKIRRPQLNQSVSEIDYAAAPDIVLIHDGARPLISEEAIEAVTKAALEFGAAICAVSAKDTIKIADKDGFIRETTNRSLTWQAQTPQAFRFDDILAAYETALGFRCGAVSANMPEISITDDAMVYQAAYPGRLVRLVDGGDENIKLTLPSDIIYAEMLLDKRRLRERNSV